MLVQYPAVGSDDEGFRHAVDAPVDTGAAVEIGQHRAVGIAAAAQPLADIGLGILVVDADQSHGAGLGQAHQERMLDLATGAPAGEEIDQQRLAEEIGIAAQRRLGRRRRFRLWKAQLRQRKGRRRLADQRARQDPGIVAQADREEGQQHAEDQQGNRIAHGSSVRGSGGIKQLGRRRRAQPCDRRLSPAGSAGRWPPDSRRGTSARRRARSSGSSA